MGRVYGDMRALRVGDTPSQISIGFLVARTFDAGGDALPHRMLLKGGDSLAI